MPVCVAPMRRQPSALGFPEVDLDPQLAIDVRSNSRCSLSEHYRPSPTPSDFCSPAVTPRNVAEVNRRSASVSAAAAALSLLLPLPPPLPALPSSNPASPPSLCRCHAQDCSGEPENTGSCKPPMSAQPGLWLHPTRKCASHALPALPLAPLQITGCSSGLGRALASRLAAEREPDGSRRCGATALPQPLVAVAPDRSGMLPSQGPTCCAQPARPPVHATAARCMPQTALIAPSARTDCSR